MAFCPCAHVHIGVASPVHMICQHRLNIKSLHLFGTGLWCSNLCYKTGSLWLPSVMLFVYAHTIIHLKIISIVKLCGAEQTHHPSCLVGVTKQSFHRKHLFSSTVRGTMSCCMCLSCLLCLDVSVSCQRPSGTESETEEEVLAAVPPNIQLSLDEFLKE
jgi:hypothetical protein